MFSAKLCCALVLACEPIKLTKSWAEIVKIQSELSYPEHPNLPVYSFSVSILPEIDGFNLSGAEFVFDYDRSRKVSRVETPLALQEINNHFSTNFSLWQKEIGAHGIRVHWQKPGFCGSLSAFFILEQKPTEPLYSGVQ